MKMNKINLPKDFIDQIKEELPFDYEAFFECYEKEPVHSLRWNPGKAISDEIKEEILGRYGIDDGAHILWEKDGYYYSEKLEDEQENRPGKSVFHEAGAFYIQEASAMYPVSVLDPRPGEIILDLCASPGGKSTQILSKMNNDGFLVSNEIVPQRAKNLSQNIERMGYRNCLVTNEEPGDLSKHFQHFFDKILVDAPCSGEGMFRKNPLAIEEWSVENVELCRERQLDILHKATTMLKAGGEIVYSTCTFAHLEDEEVINTFLETHPDFKLDKMEYLYPHKVNGEGHFGARLLHSSKLDTLTDGGVDEESFEEVSSNGSKNKKDKKFSKGNKKDKSNSKTDKQTLALAIKLFEQFITKVADGAAVQELNKGEMLLFGDNLYRMPLDIKIDGLKVERAGLHLGSIVKNRFEPSHALAMALTRTEILKAHQLELLEEESAIAYLRGESIGLDKLAVDSKEYVLDGYGLVIYMDLVLGWGKLTGNQIKNHYPKGLRKDLD